MIYHHQDKKAMALHHLRIAKKIHGEDSDVERLLSDLSADPRITVSNF